MAVAPPAPPLQTISSNSRKRKKYADGEKEPRKANYVKKVIGGDIRNEEKRKRFDKRYLTVKNKAAQLHTLCGTEVIVVSFSPDGHVSAFPETPSEVLRERVANYRKLSEENSTQEINLMGLLQSQMVKLLDKKLEPKISKLSEWLNGRSQTEALDFLETKLKGLKEKIGQLQTANSSSASSNSKQDQENSTTNTTCYLGDFAEPSTIGSANHVYNCDMTDINGVGSLATVPTQMSSDNCVGELYEDDDFDDVLIDNVQMSSLLYDYEAMPVATWAPYPLFENLLQRN